MSDFGNNSKNDHSIDDGNESDAPSEYHNPEPYVKTPSPPIPLRDSTMTPVDSEDSMSRSSSVASRLGQLEEQNRTHSEARKAQAARNSVTSIESAKKSGRGDGDEGKSDKMISNSPDGGEDEYDEEQQEVEKVLSAELVSDDELSAKDMESVMKAALFDLFVVVPIMFIPTIFLYFCLDEPVYNIVSTKNPQYMNYAMECIRYNIFVTLAYGLFVVFDVLSLVVPESVLMFTPVVKDSPATSFMRGQMHLLINVRKHVALSAWFIALIPIAAIILYKSMFVTPWDLVSKLMDANVEKAAEAATTAEQNRLIADETRSMMQRNVEVGLVLLAIFSSVLAIEKYLIQMISLNFHRMAFSQRISECNRRFGYLIKLYQSVKFGKPRVLSNHSLTLLDIDSSADLSTDSGLKLTSVHRAKSVARLIYRSLLPADAERTFLLPEDFKNWTNHPEETFNSFDLDGSGRLEAAELEDAIIDIFNSRTHVSRGLKSNGRIVRKLDKLFFIVAMCIGAVLASPVFDVGAGKLFVSLGVLSTGFGFMFHSTAKSCFESLLFVFIQHPFDVGDRVIIDDETFVIDDIEVFTTKMVRWDGVLVYITNSSLCSKTIQNIRRSEDQMEALAIKIQADTPTESLMLFKDELRKQLLEHSSNFTGEMDLANLDKLPANNEPLGVTVLAQVRGNFQNPAKRNARKTEFLGIVDTALSNANIIKA